MQTLNYRQTRRESGLWIRLRDRLVYLPGAFVLAYGFWLSLSA